MPTKTWKPHPLSTTTVEILKRKSPVKDADLYELIKQVHDESGFADFNKTLMRLEIQGIVYVSTRTKGTRMIELIRA